MGSILDMLFALCESWLLHNLLVASFLLSFLGVAAPMDSSYGERVTTIAHHGVSGRQ